jgi:ribose 5-phosphate isomerase B
LIVKWYAAADHAGHGLKQILVERLRGLGDEVEDLGTNSDDSVDYPDYGASVGRQVAAEPGAFGLLVCGTGIGVAIAANKIPGVRAAVVTDGFTARAARGHNDANVLALGARVMGVGVAEDALLMFRDTPFEGGRHARRVEKIAALERADRGKPDDGGGGEG